MSEKLLAMLITRAGPNLAKIIARAIVVALTQLANRTETEVDDAIVDWLTEQLGDIIEHPEKLNR